MERRLALSLEPVQCPVHPGAADPEGRHQVSVGDTMSGEPGQAQQQQCLTVVLVVAVEGLEVGEGEGAAVLAGEREAGGADLGGDLGG